MVVSMQQTESNRSKGQKRGQRKEKVKLPTKVIVRCLPPTMSEEEFLEHIQPMPENEAFFYCTADWSLGYDATCRAYIYFKNYDEVFNFRDRFDGYVFVDTKGVEYPAIVEFAPFQEFAKKSRRVDNKVDTIEQEPHYQQFLEKLKERKEAAAKGSECKMDFVLDRKKEDKITSTPLLQYLANKKEKRREEQRKRIEEKRRQREEEKEKRRILVAPAQSKVSETVVEQDTAAKEEIPKPESGRDRKRDRNEKRSERKKRAAEREQRRREEQQQRKHERGRREKDASATKREESKPSAEAKQNTAQGGHKSTETKKQEEECAVEKRKEGGGGGVGGGSGSSKRYSEKRERDRNRNRRDKDKQKDDKKAASETKATEPVNAAANEGKDEHISENVKAFIRSVAKEFVPKEKQQDEAATEQVKEQVAQEPKITIEKATTKKEEREINKQLKDLFLNEKPDGKDKHNDKREDDTSKYATKSDEGSNSTSDRQTQKSRSREERRIRNKDRPSIAIYQPKARLRLSEERDTSATGKDMRSNPTSDCEVTKREEPQGKKISRYSERRAERRANREKQRSSGVGAGAGEDASEKSAKSKHRKLEKSVSLEEKIEKTAEKDVTAATEKTHEKKSDSN